MTTNRKAVFFDRDGVLNQLVERDGTFYSPQSFKDFKIYLESIDIVEQVQKLGFLAIVISNQPDIARGKLEQSELDLMTQVLFSEIKVDDVLYCTHDDQDQCDCRKPKPGLFHLAQQKYNINFNDSIMVGDTWKDVEAAKNAGIEFFILNRDYNQELQNVERIDSISDIIDKLQ